MSKLNTPVRRALVFTHEGAKAEHVSQIEQLKRTVLACMLWEDGFYESGEAIADRIKRLVKECKPYEVAELAVRARDDMRLRHIPLLLVRELARDAKRCEDGMIATLLEHIVQRADEMAEFVALYWTDGKKPLAKQVKLGLARAFNKFDAYQLGKYNRDGAVKLRDVLFLTHPKPKDAEQAAVWKRLVDGTLEAPDTWEVALSDGADKKDTFERLLLENKLGYMALLRNLRNMTEASVDRDMIIGALTQGAKKSKALPFRYLAAARAVPSLEQALDTAMQIAMLDMPKLPGRTGVLVDVSGSMKEKLSSKSDLTRLDTAKALAMLVRGVADECRVFVFNNDAREVPARQGMALADAIGKADGGTMLGRAILTATAAWRDMDRLIVITDEQSSDRVGRVHGKGYIINVASASNGVGANQGWVKITGFSEAVVNYIIEAEKSGA